MSAEPPRRTLIASATSLAPAGAGGVAARTVEAVTATPIVDASVPEKNGVPWMAFTELMSCEAKPSRSLM